MNKNLRRYLNKMGALAFVSFSLLSVGCSNISMERTPSSIGAPSYENCELKSENGKDYQIFVDGKAYPENTDFSAHEAQKMLTRYGQTKTCH